MREVQVAQDPALLGLKMQEGALSRFSIMLFPFFPPT